MRKNIAKVIQAFLKREACKGDSKKTCWTDGGSIYSYNMRIAWRDDKGNVVVTSERSSRTTNSQINACRLAFRFVEGVQKSLDWN